MDLHAKIELRPLPGFGLRRAARRPPASRPTAGHRPAVVRDDAGPDVLQRGAPRGLRLRERRGRQARRADRLDRRGARRATTPSTWSPPASTGSRTSASGSRAQSGLTISIDDVRTPPEKQEILDRYEKEAEKAEAQFKRGIITDDERRQKEVEIWTSANSEVGRAMEQTLAGLSFNPLDMMVDSGARGNSQQIRQIAGMKGLVSNPRGEMIPRPIKSSFREGLSVLEYFISTHGARKGLADTALRTADSGYLTRRLVDVAQELIVREDDCGTDRGIWIEDVVPDSAGQAELPRDPRLRPRARRAGRPRGRDHDRRRARCSPTRSWPSSATTPAIDRIRVRSVLTCEADARRLRRLLRPVARDRPDDRARRGRRRHRRPVDRRAGHPAHDADLPHRWRRR